MIGFVCGIFKPFENLTSDDFFREPLVKIIGHRGCNQLGGENTLKGIKKALDMGTDGVEIDLRMVANKIIVLHDETVDRTTNGQGHYKTFNLKELQDLKCRNGCKIPLLEEIITIPKTVDELILEIKEPGIEQTVLRTIKAKCTYTEGGYFKNIVVSSFDPETTENLSLNLNDWNLAILYKDSFFSAMQRAITLGARYIHAPLKDISLTHVRSAHVNNIEIYAYTVNEKKDYDFCLTSGVDGIFSDDPKKFVNTK